MKKQKDFTLRFTVNATAEESIKAISRVGQWWAKQFKGKAAKLKDRFSVHFGGPKDTFVDFRISELIPGERVVWRVTDCNLHWIADKKEWKDTECIWELMEQKGKTKIIFTHQGLTPQSECYESCKPGWTHHIKDSLVKLIETGKGFPE